MKVHFLALLCIAQTLLACRNGSEPTQIAEANLTAQCSPAAKAEPPATNLIFKSEDGGQTWQDISAGLPQKLSVGRAYATSQEILLATNDNLYHGTLDGSKISWTNELLFDLGITGFYQGKNGLYVSGYRSGLFLKVLGTEVLMPLHNTLEDKTVRCVLEAPDGALFVGCESGVYKSTDGGNNWKHVVSGTGANSFASAEGVLICGTYEGLLRSTDGGETWENVLSEDFSAYGTSFVDGRFIAITQGGKWQDHPTNRLRSSIDGGKTWQRMDESLASSKYHFTGESSVPTIENINDLKKAGQYLFCSTDAGVFRSADWGKTWEPIFELDGNMFINLTVSGNTIYAIPGSGC